MFPNNTNASMYYNPQQIYPNYRQPSTIAGLKGRPVTSLEEARVASIDFDGSISFFPDLANGKIYTKQINNDGTVSMNCYSFTEIPAPKSEQELYVTKEEFQKEIEQFKQALAKLTAAPQTLAAQPTAKPTLNF